MAQNVHLEIVTPTRKVVSVECSNVLVPGHKSELGVLPEHNDLVSTLLTGVVSYSDSGETKKVAVREGFLQVSKNKVLLLADDAKQKSEVDPAELEQKRKQVEGQLISEKVSLNEREAVFIERDWLEACLNIL